MSDPTWLALANHVVHPGQATAPNPTNKGYLSGGGTYLYPGAGDPLPAGGERVHLLTRGGITTQGYWGDPFFIGYAKLHKRDRVKEAKLGLV